MKRFYITFLAAAALFAGCTKDNDLNSDGTSGQIPIELRVSVADAGRMTGSAFEAGDVVGLFVTEVGESTPYIQNVKLTVLADGRLASDETLYYPLDRGQVEMVAYYPYQEGENPSVAVAVAANQSTGLPACSTLRVAQMVTPQANTFVELQFQKTAAVLNLNIYDATFTAPSPVATINAAISANLNLATGVYTAQPAEEVTAYALSESSFQALVIPQELPAGTAITVSDGTKSYEFTLKEAFNVVGGTSNVITLGADPDMENVVDLSANGTANCYVVNQSNTWYRFRADVQGNGATVGNIAPKSINPAFAYSLWSIVTPYPDPTQTSSLTDDMGSGCDLTMDTTILLNSVKLRDGYIYFKTADPMVPGNVVIAAADADSNIVWSWHMWCVEGFDPEATAQSIEHPAVDGDVIMMDRNLGAYSNGSLGTWADLSNSLGMQYQWGRKDPFPGSKAMNGWNYFKAYYDPASKTVMNGTEYVPKKPVGQIISSNSEWQKAIDYSIAHPREYITPHQSNGTSLVGVPYAWMGLKGAKATDGWAALWGNTGNNTAIGSGQKSIYDPCPVGWRVPDPEAFLFVTSDGSNAPTNTSVANMWKYNVAEDIDVFSGNAKQIIIDCSETEGFHFYIKGAKSLDEDGETILLPEDQTTMYFPGTGYLAYGSGNPMNKRFATDDNASVSIFMATNTTMTGSSAGYAYRMNVFSNGNFASMGKGNYEQLATGISVRCVKE